MIAVINATLCNNNTRWKYQKYRLIKSSTILQFHLTFARSTLYTWSHSKRNAKLRMRNAKNQASPRNTRKKEKKKKKERRKKSRWKGLQLDPRACHDCTIGGAQECFRERGRGGHEEFRWFENRAREGRGRVLCNSGRVIVISLVARLVDRIFFLSLGDWPVLGRTKRGGRGRARFTCFTR